MYKSRKFAKMIGVSLKTLYNWHENSKLIPDQVTNTKIRYYSHKQYQDYMKLKFNIEVK